MNGVPVFAQKSKLLCLLQVRIGRHGGAAGQDALRNADVSAIPSRRRSRRRSRSSGPPKPSRHPSDRERTAVPATHLPRLSFRIVRSLFRWMYSYIVPLVAVEVEHAAGTRGRCPELDLAGLGRDDGRLLRRPSSRCPDGAPRGGAGRSRRCRSRPRPPGRSSVGTDHLSACRQPRPSPARPDTKKKEKNSFGLSSGGGS